MNIKKKLAIACLAANLAIPAAYAQLAKKEGITLEEIGKELGDLAEKKDTASRNRLAFEAKALASSNEESFVQVAVKIYAFMGDKAESERISNSIVKRFPKGNKARQEGYQEVFNYTTGGTAAIEKAYKAWLKKFPETPEEAGGSLYIPRH